MTAPLRLFVPRAPQAAVLRSSRGSFHSIRATDGLLVVCRALLRRLSSVLPAGPSLPSARRIAFHSIRATDGLLVVLVKFDRHRGLRLGVLVEVTSVAGRGRRRRGRGGRGGRRGSSRGGGSGRLLLRWRRLSLRGRGSRGRRRRGLSREVISLVSSAHVTVQHFHDGSWRLRHIQGLLPVASLLTSLIVGVELAVALEEAGEVLNFASSKLALQVCLGFGEGAAVGILIARRLEVLLMGALDFIELDGDAHGGLLRLHDVHAGLVIAQPTSADGSRNDTLDEVGEPPVRHSLVVAGVLVTRSNVGVSGSCLTRQALRRPTAA